MIDIIFLSLFGIVWLVFASIHDLKYRLIPDWVPFSLVIFALGFRFFYSLFNENFMFFYQGLIGLGIFFVIGMLLYYGRIFAGGDAKLMIALGAVIPFSEILKTNLESFSLFIVMFLVVGAVYGLLWSLFLPLRDKSRFSEEFAKQMKKNRKFVILFLSLAIIIMLTGFFQNMFFYLGVLVFLTPYLYVYTKSIDEAIMSRKIHVSKLEEGDVLCEDLKIGRKIIKKNWEGLNREQIKEIEKKMRYVRVKEGIPFAPVFLISFLIYVWLYVFGVDVGGVIKIFSIF